MATQRVNRPLLLGHRGARAVKSIPENTLASFDRALADGCDGFEFDVRRTGDGTAVVCHDPAAAGIEIARASVSQLPQLPQLEDVLARYQDRAFVDIELKVPGLERITLGWLRKYPLRHGFVVSSFLPEVLRDLYAADADIPLGLICEGRAELRRWSQLPIQYVMLHYRLLDSTLIRQLRGAGKKILVWTVNAPAEMRRFAEAGVDGIISDDPKVLSQTLAE
jgi:glycerophosphoryl diester phosphodiesterase